MAQLCCSTFECPNDMGFPNILTESSDSEWSKNVSSEPQHGVVLLNVLESYHGVDRS